jgi:hypothetical protein
MSLILALIWLLVVAVVVYLIARFIITVISGQAGSPPWLAQGVWLIAGLIVILYFVGRTLPVLLHAFPFQ